MRYSTTAIVAAIISTVSAQYQAGNGEQCGGSYWGGTTTCKSGLVCVKYDDFYSTCQPRAAPSEADAKVALAGTGPGKTLQSGYYWIRAVTAPNFQKYLQTKPLYSTGDALMGDYTTAGQFQVVDGQLVALVSAPGEAVKLLYGVVGEKRVINDNSLALNFSETKNTYGKFAWQGDGLQWTAAGVTRPNAAAWFVCTGQKLYINLGNYAYQTPSGCADQTIHYYNDKTANN